MISLHVLFVGVVVFQRTHGVGFLLMEFTHILGYMKQSGRTNSEHLDSMYIPATPYPHQGQEQADFIVVVMIIYVHLITNEMYICQYDLVVIHVLFLIACYCLF